MSGQNGENLTSQRSGLTIRYSAGMSQDDDETGFRRWSSSLRGYPEGSLLITTGRRATLAARRRRSGRASRDWLGHPADLPCQTSKR
jgi:hypothetical protein